MERDQKLDHEESGIGLYPEGSKNDWRYLLVIYTQIVLIVWQSWLQCGKWIRGILERKGKYLLIYFYDPKI